MNDSNSNISIDGLQINQIASPLAPKNAITNALPPSANQPCIPTKKPSSVFSGLMKQAWTLAEVQIDKVLDIQPASNMNSINDSFMMWSDIPVPLPVQPPALVAPAQSDTEVKDATSQPEASSNMMNTSDTATNPTTTTTTTKQDQKQWTVQDFHRLISTIKERDEKIEALMNDAQVLTKENGRLNQTLRNLRIKETEREVSLKVVEQKQAEAVKKAQALQLQVQEYEEKNSLLSDRISSLEQANSDHILQIKELENNLQSSQRAQEEQKEELDQVVDERNVLKSAHALLLAQNQSDSLRHEMLQNDELKQQLTELRIRSDEMEQKLRLEMNELRSKLSDAETALGWKEDEFRRENTAYNLKLNSLYTELEELRDTSQQASAPLLRQIEHLQSQNVMAQTNWEHVEKHLRQQLRQAEVKAEEYKEDLRSTEMKLQSIEARLRIQDGVVEHQRGQYQELSSQFEEAEVKVKELEQQLDSLGRTWTQRLQEKTDEMNHVQATVRQESAERVNKLETQLREKESELERFHHLQRERKSIQSPAIDERKRLYPPLSPVSVAGQFQSASRVSQLEGEVESLVDQLKNVTEVRDGLANELLKLTVEMDRYKTIVTESESVKDNAKDLQLRYDNVLVLLGEKTERLEELKLDIEEMKLAYRNQIEELVEKMNKRV